MPKRHITELTCNVCGRKEQQDADTDAKDANPAALWMELKVADPTDARKKLEPVICPKCVAAIAESLPTSSDVESVPRAETAVR